MYLFGKYKNESPKHTQYFSFEIHVRKDFDNNAGVHNNVRFSRFERIIFGSQLIAPKNLYPH